MSLLNKMLADLETRGVTGAERADPTAGLRPAAVPVTTRAWLYPSVALLTAGALALGWWWQASGHRPEPLAAPARPAAPAVAVVVPQARPLRIPRRSVPRPVPARGQSAPVAPRPVVAVSTGPQLKQQTVLRDQAVQKVLLPPSPAHQARVRYREALGALRVGRPGLAMRDLRQALVDDPDAGAARLLLATLEVRGGSTAQAAADLKAGLARAPGSAPLLEMLAQLRLKSAGPAAALALLQAHARAAAHHPTYLALQAALEEQLGVTSAAALDYRRALALAPDQGRYWAGLGMAIQATDPTAARVAFRKALQDPNLQPTLRSYCTHAIQ